MKRSRMKVETVREVKQDPRSEIIRFDLCESYEKVITVLDYNGVCDLEWFSVLSVIYTVKNFLLLFS